MKLRQFAVYSASPPLSPLRYPGGKSWLAPEIRAWLVSLAKRPTVLVEPFAGGGSVSLLAVAENLVDKVVMCEKDPGIAAVWQTILDDAEWLAARIWKFEMNQDTVRELLSKQRQKGKKLAFQTLVRNRVNRNGIIAQGAGMIKAGEGNRGIASRWYPYTLAARIMLIHLHRQKIDFIEGDGMDLIQRHVNFSNAAFFIDPPYTAEESSAGHRLYDYNEIDHEKLFALIKKARGNFLMTYDKTQEVSRLAKESGFLTQRVKMPNSTKEELLIARDFKWRKSKKRD